MNPVLNIVAVTSCTTGIAKTYGSRRFRTLCQGKGHFIKVETQGAFGTINQVSGSDLNSAVFTILTNDTVIDNDDRFDGIKTISVQIDELLVEQEKIIDGLAMGAH